MKKQLLVITTLTLILIIPAKIIAQSNWAPAGATWYHGLHELKSGDIYYNTTYSIGQKNINGKVCQIVQKSYETCNRYNSTQYMYEDSNKVFYYDDVSDRFLLLYDFNKNAGESWTLEKSEELSYADNIIITVDSVSSININSHNLKVQYVTMEIISGESYFKQEVITERLGFSTETFPFIDSVCFRKMEVELRCYYDSEIGLYETGIPESCTYTGKYVGIDTKKNENIIIYPNPIKDKLSISIKDNTKTYSSFEIYNSIGKKVFSDAVRTNEITINTLNWNTGVYVLILKGNSTICRKIIIKQ